MADIVQVVDEESASPTVQDVERAGIQADHSHMCKFENERAPGFDLVVDGIQRYAEEAPTTIKMKWDSEKTQQWAQKKATSAALDPGDFHHASMLQAPTNGFADSV